MTDKQEGTRIILIFVVLLILAALLGTFIGTMIWY